MQVSCGTLEAKVLGDQGIDEHGMIFVKQIKIKLRGFGLLNYQTKIRNKLGFYLKGDT